jgi:hypothetical protein
LQMTHDDVPDHLPQPIEDWFSSRGFKLVISEDDGVFWAALVNATGGIVAPRYGRGHDAIEAAERARERFLVEE